jgi:hypothetical protein
VPHVYRFRLDYDPLFQFLAQGQMSQRAVDYFRRRNLLVRAFISGKPDDERNGDVSTVKVDLLRGV